MTSSDIGLMFYQIFHSLHKVAGRPRLVLKGHDCSQDNVRLLLPQHLWYVCEMHEYVRAQSIRQMIDIMIVIVKARKITY